MYTTTILPAELPTLSMYLPWYARTQNPLPGDGKFPVFAGEWEIQTVSDNLFSTRAENLNTGLYAFAKYTHGSAYWTAKFSGTATVVVQGTQADYWSYEDFISLGYVNRASGAQYCSWAFYVSTRWSRARKWYSLLSSQSHSFLLSGLPDCGDQP